MLRLHLCHPFEEESTNMLLNFVNSVKLRTVERQDFVSIESRSVTGSNNPSHLLIIEICCCKSLEEKHSLLFDLSLHLTLLIFVNFVLNE